MKITTTLPSVAIPSPGSTLTWDGQAFVVKAVTLAEVPEGGDPAWPDAQPGDYIVTLEAEPA